MKRRSPLAATAAAVTAAIPLVRPAVAQQSKVLRFVPHANLTLLDPIFTTALVSINHGWAIYDTLFSATSKFELRPQMADGYTLSDDGRTYTIKLRDNLKFHNGEKVRAQDAAPSLARWAARETMGQTLWKFVDVCEAQDDRTIRIVLEAEDCRCSCPRSRRAGASMPFIVPEHVAKSESCSSRTALLGHRLRTTLKFVKSEFVPGSHVVYEKNTDYVPRQEPVEWTSGGKVVHFDRVEWEDHPGRRDGGGWRCGTARLTGHEQVHPDLVANLRENPDMEIGSANPTGFNAVLRFNHLHPPFNNLGIRRAVMMAVNQEDYMAAITGGDPTAYRVCKAMLPCGTRHSRETGGPVMQANLEKARAMLKEAGYKGEKVVIISPSEFPTIGPLGEVTNDVLTKLGMNVEFVSTDWGTVTQRRASKEPPEKGGWSLLHTWFPSNIAMTPVEQFFIRGLGQTGWFGWWPTIRRSSSLCGNGCWRPIRRGGRPRGTRCRRAPSTRCLMGPGGQFRRSAPRGTQKHTGPD